MYVAALLVVIQKFKFLVKLPNKIKTRIIFAKNESFIHIAEWILLLSQQLLKLSNVCSITLSTVESVMYCDQLLSFSA